MRIGSSVIGMESARSYTSVTRKTVRQTILGQSMNGLLNTSLTDAGSTGEEMSAFDEILNAKEEKNGTIQNELYERNNQSAIVSSQSIVTAQEKKSIEKIKEECVQYLIYLLFNGDAKSRFKEMMKEAYNKSAPITTEPRQQTATLLTVQQTTTEYFKEHENTSFHTTGTVKTADGREITFNLDLSMSRSFEEYYETTYQEEVVKMIDPLVINLDSNIAGLSDQKFEFDLDTDGIKDSISMLSKGSGYLALDKNKNGKVDDGSELFGTKSGNGFADLAKYDMDGNGWIDEADDIFDKLLIWSKNENGEDELYTLKEAGVGAICLQKASTNFSLNSVKNNQTNGAIRSTGIFLYENGNVGTVQHIDVAQ